jgi:hypothetical protein
MVVFFFDGRSGNSITLSGVKDLSSIDGGTWDELCISGSNAILATDFHGKESCWPSDEVPDDSSYITTWRGNSCKLLVSSLKFPAQFDSETRCFSKMDAANIKLIDQNGAVSIRTGG